MRIISGNALLRTLLLLVCLSPGFAVAGPPLQVQPASEEATPDSPSTASDGDPAQLRAAHLVALGADRWHAAGWRGKGIKIAILDTGFHDYHDQLGKALPAKVLTKAFRRDSNLEARNSQHGILCGEVVHALAPDADVMLVTWDADEPEQFFKAVRWARQQGAQVITCSVIMPSWSDGNGGGRLHKELTEALGDALFFASAGNTARRHWSGAFHDGGDGFHEWQAGVTTNAVKPWDSGERVSVEMYWQPGPRYKIIVEDTTSGSAVGHATGHCGPTRCSAVVRFTPESKHEYRVRVQKTDGPTEPFHLVILGGDLGCASAEGSIAFPADGPEVIAVGAVERNDRRASYSSCGPISSQPKPDLVAPVPFPSLYRDRPFAGTSAAAPQAAALAALLWSRHPDWNAGQVREGLRRSARDIGPPGHDWETGYGVVTLPARDVPAPPVRAAR